MLAVPGQEDYLGVRYACQQLEDTVQEGFALRIVIVGLGSRRPYGHDDVAGLQPKLRHEIRIRLEPWDIDVFLDAGICQ